MQASKKRDKNINPRENRRKKDKKVINRQTE